MPRGKKIRNEEMDKLIMDNLKLGMTQKDTAELLGFSENQFALWIKKDSDFGDAVKKAMMECKKRNIGIIQQAAIKTWQAAAWWLERKHNIEFAMRQEYEHSGNVIMNVVAFNKADPINKNIKKNAISYHRPLQLAAGKTSVAGFDKSGKIQNNSLAPQGTQDNAGVERTDTLVSRT